MDEEKVAAWLGGATRGPATRTGRAPWEGRGLRDEELAQGTFEYALTVAAILAMLLALGALWRAGAEGKLALLAERAASHVLMGTGLLDIPLF